MPAMLTCRLFAGVALMALAAGSAAAASPKAEVLHRFSGGTDGGSPAGALIMDTAGNLYGAAGFGDKDGDGVVFKLSPPAKGNTAWTETVPHHFSGADGSVPSAGLVVDHAGNLYGTTELGGDMSDCSELGYYKIGCGIAFRLSPPATGKTAWTETVLHRFNFADGQNPEAGLIADGAGNLYGTTFTGNNYSGCAGYGCGTVFKLSPPAKGKTAWTETVLHSFNGTDGQDLEAGLIADGAGNLYGTTPDGGSGSDDKCEGCGTVFKLSSPAKRKTAWTETVLHSFIDTDGSGPSAGLIADGAGNFYGTTEDGGNISECSGIGCGTVFKLSPPAKGKTAWTEMVLHRFDNGTGGRFPAAQLIADSAGNFYGTTSRGGDLSKCDGFGCGAVFKLSPPAEGKTAWTETVLHRFIDTDGSRPGGLVADRAGHLYGTTSFGGNHLSGCDPDGCGVVFEITGSGFKP